MINEIRRGDEEQEILREIVIKVTFVRCRI